MGSQSKKRAWVAPSFDDPDDDFLPARQLDDFDSCDDHVFQTRPLPSLGRSRRANLTAAKLSKTVPVISSSKVLRPPQLWCDEPVSKALLAVHPKKVKEVEQWLSGAFKGQQGHRLLLLTGPSGSGKTACVRALAADMALTVKEWINSTTALYSKDGTRNWATDAAWVPGDSVEERGQVAQFREFVTRVSKYGSVATEASNMAAITARTLLLVEDLPNAFYRDPSQFHDILRHYAASGCSPAVFILSDSPQQEHSAKHLFPPHLYDTLPLINIQFNPVASSLLTKALCQLCEGHGLPAQPDLLNTLAAAAAGDLRTAVNALQFSLADPDESDPLLAGGRGALATKSKKGGRGRGGRGRSAAGRKDSSLKASQESLAAVGGKDAALLIFRALGKVLYCKRTDDPAPPLPLHLRREERRPALEDADAVLDKSPLLPSTFITFMHQNYTPFLPNVKAAVMAATYLSDADVVMGHWTERDVLSSYCSIGVRGLMHATGTDQSSSSSGQRQNTFRPLVSPASTEVQRRAEGCRAAIRSLYRHHDMHDLTTLLIPYAAKIQKNIYTPASSLLQEVGMLSSSAAVLRNTRDKLAPLPPPPPPMEEDLELDYPVEIEEIDD